ncbi:MAG: hypothetical protein H6834_18215 [Planctomycetes bacterium]|nr:hypothetical protein [Planctomycetota bacterium]
MTIDTRTATVRHELTTLRGDVGSLAFDADERLLAVAGGTSAGPGIPADAGVRVFDLATGERRHALSGHRAPVVAIAFPHDGATLVTAALDGTIHTWDLASGERRATTNVPSLRDLEPFQTVCEGIVHITPDGKIATVLRNDALERWDLGSGERLPMDAPRKGHQVLSHVLSKDARFALACSTQRSRDRGTATHGASPLNAWNLATGRWEGSFGDFTQRVLATTFVDSGSDGEREVFALFADGRTSRWDFASGRELASFAGFGVPVRDACFTSDGNSVTMLLDDGRVQRLATRGGSHVPNMHVPGVRDPSIAGATGDIALIVHRGGYARWDLASWNAVAFTPADGGNGVAALSMDGKRTAVVTAHGVEFIDGEGLHAGSGFETKENALALMFAGEGAMLAGCWRAGHVRVFDEHGMLAWQARVRGVPVRALPSVDGTRVLVSTLRGQVFVIERDAPDTPKLLEEVSGYALALTPDGRYAVTSGSYAEHGEDTSTWNEPARLIDLERGEVVATIDLPSGALHAAASRDGQRIAVVGWDKIVRVWDRSRESVVATFGVLPEAITQLVITPDGRFVAVTGWDQVVRILDVQTSALRHRLDLPENSHPRLLFDRTGRWLLIATFRGEVRAIPMDPATFARTIRRPDAPMPSVDSQKKR